MDTALIFLIPPPKRFLPQLMRNRSEIKDASGNEDVAVAAGEGYQCGQETEKRAILTESHENNGQPQNNKSNVRNTESGKPREA
jgi:hypothetical protein